MPAPIVHEVNCEVAEKLSDVCTCEAADKFEVFWAEPLRHENSWRVISSWSRLVANRVSQDIAEQIATSHNEAALKLRIEAALKNCL